MGYSRHNCPPLLSRYVVDDNGCWIWQGEIGRYGYGVVTIGQRRTGDRVRQAASRYFYEQLVGPIPDGLFICHACDNRACVNPEHLWPGTQKDNIQDMHAKGRGHHKGAPGTRNASAKLSEDAAREIKYGNGRAADLAGKHSVCLATIYMIRSGANWRHI